MSNIHDDECVKGERGTVASDHSFKLTPLTSEWHCTGSAEGMRRDSRELNWALRGCRISRADIYRRLDKNVPLLHRKTQGDHRKGKCTYKIASTESGCYVSTTTT